jgi:hypothetical protein
MSKYLNSKVKSFVSAKDANDFISSGIVGFIIGLFQGSNGVFTLFYLEEPEKKLDKTKLNKKGE